MEPSSPFRVRFPNNFMLATLTSSQVACEGNLTQSGYQWLVTAYQWAVSVLGWRDSFNSSPTDQGKASNKLSAGSVLAP